MDTPAYSGSLYPKLIDWIGEIQSSQNLSKLKNLKELSLHASKRQGEQKHLEEDICQVKR